MLKRRIIPSTNYIKFEHSVPGVDIFYKIDKTIIAMAFHGRKNKSTWHYSFATEEKMLLRIDGDIKKQYDANLLKNKQKIEKKLIQEEHRKKVQVGDIFHTSWGYDETHVEFFQVQEKVSKAKVKIQQIKSIAVSEGYNTARVKALPDEFIGEPKICTMNAYGSISKADCYGNPAYLGTRDQSHYTSWGR